MEKEFKEALERKIKEEADAKQIALLKVRLKLTILELVVFLIGGGIVWYQINGYVLCGIMLMMWGNNLTLMRAAHKLKNNFYKKVWQDS